MRELTMEDARATAMGGLVFGAGGGGLEEGLRTAESVFALGHPKFATLDELLGDAQTFVSTGVGAPGAHTDSGPKVLPRDKLRALELWRAAVASSPRHREAATKLAGLIVGHPTSGTVGAWLPAAVDPNLVVIDCATNGRGHPAVTMGGMGLASHSEETVIQAGAGGSADDKRGRVEIAVEGPLMASSLIMREAASTLGGSISACRGPFSVEFLRESGAVGSISATLRLGRAMLAAENRGSDTMKQAIVDTLAGTVAAEGQVIDNTVVLKGSYDVGKIQIRMANGTTATLAVCNEFMALDIEDHRNSTFPDLIVVLSQNDGMPVAAATMQPGDPVAVITATSDTIPVGAGVWEQEAYTTVEQILGIELSKYALRPAHPKAPASRQ